MKIGQTVYYVEPALTIDGKLIRSVGVGSANVVSFDEETVCLLYEGFFGLRVEFIRRGQVFADQESACAEADRWQKQGAVP